MNTYSYLSLDPGENENNTMKATVTCNVIPCSLIVQCHPSEMFVTYQIRWHPSHKSSKLAKFDIISIPSSKTVYLSLCYHCFSKNVQYPFFSFPLPYLTPMIGIPFFPSFLLQTGMTSFEARSTMPVTVVLSLH
jgi:hypothetical protein